MKIEDKLNNDPDLLIITALHMGVLDGELFNYNSEKIVNWFRDIVNSLEECREKYSENQGHCGDCTNEPQPCTLCIVENHVKEAEELRKKYNGKH